MDFDRIDPTMSDSTSRFKAELLLLLVPMLWGLGYPLIRSSMDSIGPLGFLNLRFSFGLLPLAVFFGPSITRVNRGILLRGLITGVALFFAYAFLNWGLSYTTTAKAGFIIGLRVVLVPIVGMLLFRLRAAKIVWAAALLSLAGLSFIFFGEFSPPLTLNPGDGFMVASAFFFALHILLVGKFVERESYAPYLLLQIATVVVLSSSGAYIFEGALLPSEQIVWPRAALAGFLSTALAFWLQNRFQHLSSSDRTGVIFSSEPLFAALFGFFFLGELLHGMQWIGALLIVSAMALSQVSRRRASPRSLTS